MKINLLEHLVCPICGMNFTITKSRQNQGEILEGLLICSRKHKFKIINGIPRFVSDKEKDFVKTENAFSSKWKTYHKSYHEKKWYNFQRKWFMDRFGWKNIRNFNKFLQNRSTLLQNLYSFHNLEPVP